MKARLTLALCSVVMLFAEPSFADATLGRIVAERNIRLGVRTDAPPFSSIIGGRPAGFSVDLCGLIAGAILATSDLPELSGQFVEVNAENRFEKLASGDIDVLCGATTVTLTRRETISFSIPIFSTGVGALVARNAPDLLREVIIEGGPAALSNAAVTEALKGRKLGVRAGTTAEAWLASGPLAEIEGVKIVPVADHKDGITAIESGTMDVYFADQAILIAQRAASEKKANLLISRNTFTHEPYGLALRRGDEDLRLVIDRALSHIYRTGAVLHIYAKHFGKPGPEVVLFYSLAQLPE